jgi:hypothetical protein
VKPVTIKGNPRKCLADSIRRSSLLPKKAGGDFPAAVFRLRRPYATLSNAVVALCLLTEMALDSPDKFSK